MAKLTMKALDKMPKAEFGEPGSKKYPMPDKGHAADAKARASEMVNKGKLAKSTEKKIDAKADKVLAKKPAKKADADDMKGMHAHGGMMFDDALKSYHHEGSTHTSEDR